MTPEQLNQCSTEQATKWFMQTNTAFRWVQLMVESRPFTSKTQVKSQARQHWQAMDNADFLEAFEGHPMIGDISTLRKKFAATQKLASHEQSSTAHASEAVLQELKALNHAYLNRHGFIFIICASGLSAQTMLDALKARLDRPTDEEIKTAAQHQLNITLLRIDNGLSD